MVAVAHTTILDRRHIVVALQEVRQPERVVDQQVAVVAQDRVQWDSMVQDQLEVTAELVLHHQLQEHL
jgi:hypothetical protein